MMNRRKLPVSENSGTCVALNGEYLGKQGIRKQVPLLLSTV